MKLRRHGVSATLWAWALIAVFCCFTAPAAAEQPSGVVVVANRAAATVKFALTAPDQPRQEISLPVGDLVGMSARAGLQAVHPAAPNEPQTLRANAMYVFLQADDETVELREISLDEAPAAGVVIAEDPVAAVDSQLAAGTVSVKLLVDDEQRAARGYWEKRLRRRIEECSAILRRQCGLRLEVVAVGAWQSSDAIFHSQDALEEFGGRVDPAPARLAIGFASQKLDWNPAELHQSSVAGPLTRHILLPETLEGAPPDAPFEMLLHALGHWLGAVHSPEAGSTMRTAALPPDDAPPRRPLTFDPVNALLMGRVAQEARYRGIEQLARLSPDCKAQVTAAYRTLEQSLGDDPYFQLARVKLGAAPPAPPEQPNPPPQPTAKARTEPLPPEPAAGKPVQVANAAARRPRGADDPAAAGRDLNYSTAEAAALASQMATTTDNMRLLQGGAIKDRHADWGYWGHDPAKFSAWTKHSNRLIPIYTFGIGLDDFRGEHSLYRNAAALEALYGRAPDATLNPKADYFDQTAVYQLQRRAAELGKKNIILFVFDGMDWITTQAAAVYARREVAYREGRGTGLAFQDYRGAATDFGYFVTSPWADRIKYNVNTQKLNLSGKPEQDYQFGGYDAAKGGAAPWQTGNDPQYLLGTSKDRPHVVADSASTATSMCTGQKTYNTAINVDREGRQLETIAHDLQRQGRAIGVVTSVPVSHATPAAAYAHNVERHDYQDLLRDLMGQKSVSHPERPLPGVDVLIGCGWGENLKQDRAQGDNFAPGNAYIAEADLAAIDVAHGGKYRVVQRSAGVRGAAALASAAMTAAEKGERLFGFFGVGGVARPGSPGGHLPYRTADGNYNPAVGAFGLTEEYKPADILENPTLADMTRAALTVLEKNPQGMWLMVEAGDVDWANHDNNLDNSIGAVHSGDEAFRAVIEWIEARQAWSETVVIVTADHGHHFVLLKPETIAAAAK